MKRDRTDHEEDRVERNEDGQAGGLHDAAIWALRDAAAHIAFHFAATPEFKALTGAAEASG